MTLGQIEDKINELKLGRKVLLVGKVKDVVNYLRISDVLIHSSKGEGISNAILEAMFCGLPVLATNVGGTPELVYKKSFRLFEYKDVDRLYKFLLQLDNITTEFDYNDII